MTVTVTCRNCDSPNVIVLDQCYLAPFFTKRVVGLDLSTLGYHLDIKASDPESGLQARVARTLARLLKSTATGRRVINHRSVVLVPIRVCRDCGFVGPERYYSAEELMPLYVDYRSSSYNTDRSGVEPSYASLQDLVGKSAGEVVSRLANVDQIIAENLAEEEIRTVLDWGGGEARFIPTRLRSREVFVLDVSTEPLSDSAFQRIANVPPSMRFDYIQACHLLEHVSSPRELVSEMLGHANAGAFVYLEVPLGATPSGIQLFQDADPRVRHGIHEHLNLYTPHSLRALGLSLGLTELSMSKCELDFGWTKATVVSGLFQVPFFTSPRFTAD